MSDLQNHKSEAAAGAAIREKSLNPIVQPLKDGDISGDVLLVPNGQGGYAPAVPVKGLLEPYRKAPERRRGTATFTELSSFCAHVARFKDEGSVVFADASPGAPKLLAVLDYHPKGASSAPRFGAHRSSYAFPLSEEWRAWTSKEGQQLSQDAFALMIDDRMVDVIDPTTDEAKQASVAALFKQALGVAFADPGQLLALSRGLTVHASHKATNTYDPQTGTGTVFFHEEHAAHDQKGAPVKVPGAFMIGIPVFRGGDRFLVPVRLRYRLVNGALSWSYDMFARERVLDKAIRDACEHVATETGVEVLFGAPEQG